MSKCDIDKLFSPSYFTKRYKQNEAVDKYVQVLTEISQEVRETVPCQLNVKYGEREREKFDIYGTDLINAPVLIFIHGGYWQYREVSKDISNTPAKALYNFGIKTIVLGYTLAPEYDLPEIIDKCTLGLNKCIEYAIESGATSIGIAGHSAGAQIAILSFQNLYSLIPDTQRRYFKAIFLLAGIFDLKEILDTCYNEILKLSEKDATALSPRYQTYVPFQNTKFYICVGANDAPGIIKQSKVLHRVFLEQNLKNTADLLIYEDLDHYDIMENLNNSDFEIIRLIVDTLL